MVLTRSSVLAASVVLSLSCASARPTAEPQVPNAPLVGPNGHSVGVRGLSELAPLTVLVFFSPDCDCLRAHEARLRTLAGAYAARGVQVFMVDSETRASRAKDAAEGKRRGYPFPILIDHGARVADAVGAEYASYAVVLDSSGRIRYRGGMDSDKLRLHDDATPYLRNALDDLLAGKEPRTPEGKALGCALQRW
ncbi:MAG TPA: redoxin family protein [Polyangiaceae bacterium]|nr:redoxin family protein [Polyangiaceae bacterium]